MVGAAAVAAAGGALGVSRCDPMPRGATQAWKGPGQEEMEPRRVAVAYALLAPNPHNLQPWIADLRQPGVVTFRCDRTRLLAETDPFSRQIIIGCGAFLELLRMAGAAQGFRVELEPFPEGEWPAGQVGDTPLCRARFTQDTAVRDDPLFAQVLTRRTSRNPYADSPVTAAEATQLAAALGAGGVQFGWTGDSTRVAALRGIAEEAWRVEVETDATYLESVRVYRVTGREILQHRDGLSMHGPLLWWAHALGLFSREKALTLDRASRAQAFEFVNRQIHATPSFAWLVTPTNDRRAQLTAGAAYVRANLKATELGLSMGPLSQVLQEFPAMQPLLARHKQMLGLPATATVQMFVRVGRGSPVEPSPRRPLGDILRT